MPSPPANPGIQNLIQELGLQNRFGQISILVRDKGYEIRHYLDENKTADSLRTCTKEELRDIVANDANAEFRPLKSAPDLITGWRTVGFSSDDLWDLLNIIYPGAIGNSYAVTNEGPKHIVSYRCFVDRQSGMYRGASKLTENEVEQLTSTCCSPKHCIKQRLWGYKEPDQAPGTGLPRLLCIEPCQIVLELARREAKSKQEPSITLQLNKTETLALLDILKGQQTDSPPEQRAADFSDSKNPRRIDLLRARIKSQFTRQTEDLGE